MDKYALVKEPELTGSRVYFDLETVGLYGKVRLAQFCCPGDKIAQLVEYPTALQLAQWLSGKEVVGFNLHYDLTTAGFTPQHFEDLFLLSRLYYYTQEKFSLADVAFYVYGRDLYGQTEKKEMHHADWTKPLTDEQLKYAAKDVLVLDGIYDVVASCKDDLSYRIDKITLGYCLDFQRNGLPVDQSRVSDKYLENSKRIQEINLPVNCNSTKQVQAYLGSSDSQDLTLAKLSAQGNEKAKLVREAKKLTKQISFLNKFDGEYIYGKFKPSTRSGRLASDDQNLQQLPRALKGCFGFPPEAGKVLIFSDFSQLELRCVCAITGEKRMEQLYREGKDLHDYTAVMLFGEEFTKEQRQIAKTANFGLLYGAGAQVFCNILLKQAGVLLSLEEAKVIIRKWKNLWPSIVKWQNAGINAWRSGKAWATPFGRSYTAKMMTDQLNIQNQGFGADVAKLALHYSYNDITAIGGMLHNFIHDSYIWSTDADEITWQKAAVKLADSMQEAWFEASKAVLIKDLPMPVKAQVGYNWGDIENGQVLFTHTLKGMEFLERSGKC